MDKVSKLFLGSYDGDACVGADDARAKETKRRSKGGIEPLRR